MSPAAAIAIHVAALITTGVSLGWAVRRRKRSQLADRILRAKHRTRLQQRMHLRGDRDTRPAPLDETYLRLEALYRAPAAERRTP